MQVESLHIYALKGARATDLAEAAVESRGLSHDRRWMLVDENGRFLTQREQPRLATVNAAADDSGLTVSGDGAKNLHIPVPPPETEKLPLTLWKQAVEGYAAGAAADAWFSDYLRIPCRLVFQGGLARAVSQDYAPQGSQTGYADGFPLLVANAASLADLNARLETPLPMNRFRPNIVISGAEAWAEDAWKKIRIGGIEIAIVKPCTRCIVTTTDQKTGERHGNEPLRSLKDFRLLRRPGMTGVVFGQNAVPLGAGAIRAGDAVEVLETGPSAFDAT
ncbi:MAG: MOSC domain-containing protein [Alphaproteobacteria bacterium]|nr:MOSC domain-containing protein [Alphaproteobacteria bacterium]